MMNVLFIDDDYAVNRYHEIILEEIAKDQDLSLIFYQDPILAMDFLKKQDRMQFPKFIFLDINMPLMNGWEFLEEYVTHHLPEEVIVIITTTSSNPQYREKAQSIDLVKDFRIKPLDEGYFEQILKKYSK